MRPHLGLAVGFVSLAAMVALIAPAASLGAVSCAYSNSDGVLTVTAADAFTKISRSQDAIVVSDIKGPVSCTGPEPRVTKTDLVRVGHSGRRSDVLELIGGPFAPGGSLEPLGLSEIEFEYVDPTFISISGTPGPDRLTWGAGAAVNLNGDDDLDVSGPFTTSILQGFGGNDVLGAQAGYAGSDAALIASGGTGKDTLTAPRDGGVLHGGAGRDRITGGPAADNITGGRGNDLIGSGKGNDLVRAIDGTRDRVNCGAGKDRVKVDGIDKLNGCERLLRVKKAEPVRR